MNISKLLVITLTLSILTACASSASNSVSTGATSKSNSESRTGIISEYDVIADLNSPVDMEVMKKSAELQGVSLEHKVASLKRLQAHPDMAKKGYEDFQTDADIIRLQHLKYWVTLIEEYQEKTGKYPFQENSTNPVYVEIANPVQQEYINQHPPAPASTKSMKSFVQMLESGLGREIDELYDPQYAPDAKPNFYIYMISGDTYYFAVHTHQKFLFGKSIIAPHYNKVEVSNVYNNSANLVVTSEVLFNSDPYMQEVNKQEMKPEFFEMRKQKMLNATKEK